jgi:hypothetical protein
VEDVHARGAIPDATLLEITYLATGALNVWLSQHLNPAEGAPPVGVFAPLVTHPRAYAALQALAIAAETGGRRGFRMPEAPVPALPAASTYEDSAGKVRRSALSDFDVVLVGHLSAVATGEMQLLFLSSLSRLSRDSVMLATAVEFVLAHGGTLLTTNFLLRPGEAFARRPPLIGPSSHDPPSVLTDDGLAGLHAKHVRSVLAQAQDP